MRLVSATRAALGSPNSSLAVSSAPSSTMSSADLPTFAIPGSRASSAFVAMLRTRGLSSETTSSLAASLARAKRVCSLLAPAFIKGATAPPRTRPPTAPHVAPSPKARTRPSKVSALLSPEKYTPVSTAPTAAIWAVRSEEHTSELQSLMRISYAVFCLKKKKQNTKYQQHKQYQT